MAKEVKEIKTNHLGEPIKEYPKWVHGAGKDGASVLVNSAKEEAALGKPVEGEKKPDGTW